jgi:hypothetical protein
VLGNLLRPWLLARFVTSGAAAALALVVIVTALRLHRAKALTGSPEGGVVVDRRAELLAGLTSAESVLSILSLVVAAVGAERLHGTMRGAMCAYGVLAATPWGLRGLFVAAGAAVAGAVWLALHRAESVLPESALGAEKLLAAAAMAPLALADFVLSTLHALALDFREVASCCASGLEEARTLLGEDGAPRTGAVVFLFGAGVCASLLAAWNAQAPSLARARAVAALTLVAAVAAPLAITTWVAPYVYGTPNHLCPFCLLRWEEGMGLGWPLHAALFVAVTRGAAVGVTAWVAQRSGSPLLDVIVRRASVGAAVAWAVTLVLAAAPWLLYRLGTGASLFG